jgi:phage terminase large subunit
MQTWIDYNPDSEFWVHEQILRDPTRNVKLLISDHRHNPFVPDTLREKIEAIKDRDINLWKVYARGLTGKVEGLVFNNWHLYKPGQAEEDDNGLPKGARFLGYGLDFGFTNDPTSLIKMWAWGDDLLVREELYERGLTGSDINRRFKALEIDRRDQIIADGENRRLVTELGQYGWNTKLADKGPGSIEAGIDQLQRYKIWVLPGSPNMIKELRTYRWATDKDGKPTNKPVKFMDHTIDPMRYVARHTLKRPAREGRRYVFN